MSDFLSENEPLSPRGAETGEASTGQETRMDRRAFLRTLSGSALTLVAGGLTVTLTACNGGPGNNPIAGTTNLLFNSAGAVPSTFPSGSSSSSSSVTALPVAFEHPLAGWSTRV